MSLFVDLARRVVRRAHEPDAACACCGREPVTPRDEVSVLASEMRPKIANIAAGLLGLPAHYFEAATSKDLDSLEMCAQAERDLRAGEWERTLALLAGPDVAAWVKQAPTREATHKLPPDLGLRCSICAVSWPPLAGCTVCPLCNEPTDLARGLEPLSIAEALRVADERRLP